jgi:hypothetical protein
MSISRPRSHAQGDLAGDLSTLVRLTLQNADAIRLSYPGSDERSLIVTGYNGYATITYRSYASEIDNITGHYAQMVTLQTFVVVFEHDQCVYVTDTEFIHNHTAPEHQLTSAQIRKLLRAAKRCGTPPSGIFFASEPQIIQLFEDLLFWHSQ